MLHVRPRARDDAPAGGTAARLARAAGGIRGRTEDRRDDGQRLGRRAASTAFAATAARRTSLSAPVAPVASAAPGGATADKPADLKARAMADDGVQALLDVFPAEIRDVEEIK